MDGRLRRGERGWRWWIGGGSVVLVVVVVMVMGDDEGEWVVMEYGKWR